MTELYYTAPPEIQFNELKEKAIEVWSGMDNEYGYATEKIDRIKDIGNVKDNFMFIVAMFDLNNQEKLSYKLSEETRKAICERIIEAETPIEHNLFWR